jgi:hypothetical protein
VDAGTWVALYAAVVATAALAWNVARVIREQRTVVRVEVEHTPLIGDDGLVGYQIQVVARNFGPGEVVEDAGVQFEPKEDGKPGMGYSARLDKPLPPRDYLRWTLDLKETPYNAREQSRRFRGFVKLASGKEIASDVQEIRESSVEFAVLDQPAKRMRMTWGEEEPQQGSSEP